MKTIFQLSLILFILSMVSCKSTKKANDMLREEATMMEDIIDDGTLTNESLEPVVFSAMSSNISLQEISYLFPMTVAGQEKMIKQTVLGSMAPRTSDTSNPQFEISVSGTSQNFICEEKMIDGSKQLVWIGGDPPVNPR